MRSNVVGGAVQNCRDVSYPELHRVLAAADDLREAVPTESSVRDLLAGLAALVGCDQVFWTWLDTASARKVAEVGYPRPPMPVPVDEWVKHQPEHPIGSARHASVTAISDVLGRRAFHNTWLYQECFRPAGLEHEIGVNLARGPGQVNDLVLSRGRGRDFDDWDHVVLRLLRPHLDAAFRRLTLPVPVLTRREREVLALARDGLSNAAIARCLGVGESTVVKHLENVYRRIGAHSRTQAVRLCENVLE